MATYNWYFSQSGNDSTGDGSSGSPWKTLAKAKTEITAINSTDTVNLYFKRGDTWSFNTAAVSKISVHGLQIESNGPTVKIDAYGSGNQPVFDGLVSDFSGVHEHNMTTGPLKWGCIFKFNRDLCDVKNICIDRVYGVGIRYGDNTIPADGGTVESCTIKNFGSSAIGVSIYYNVHNLKVLKNLIHTGQQLYRYGKSGCANCWGSAFSFAPRPGYERDPFGNIARYNVIYDIYGEGIHGCGYVAEYNIVGDTGSYGIYACVQGSNGVDTIIRHNLVTMSSSNSYKVFAGSGYSGIVIAAEEPGGGSNADATVEVYGNIVINRHNGIMFNHYTSPSPWKEIKIYNNTVVDCDNNNFVIGTNYNMVAEGKGFWYNNTSILYDRPGSKHAADWGDPVDLSKYWTIDNNHFWTTGGNPAVDPDWQKNMTIGDPKLAGEPAIDWDGQSGATYYKDIKFSDIRPLAGSALIGSGKPLGVGFATEFLTQGTDFSTLPTSQDFVLSAQPDGAWDIGAYVSGDGSTPAKGSIVGLTYPASLEHGAMCDIKAATENIGTAPGVFEMQLLIDSILKSKSLEFVLEGGAISNYKIEPFTAPLTGESMDIVIKCIQKIE